MSRLQTTDGLTEEQVELLKLVREFVDEQIIPVATELEHKDEYPQQIVDQMKEMGIFGLMIPEEYGGLGESLLTYALCVEEIARGWMSVSGIINTHFIVAYMILQHGTEEQKQHYLPKMATGEIRGAFSMSEPGWAPTSRHQDQGRQGRRRRLDHRRPEDVADQRRLANLVAVLVKTDLGADTPLQEHDDLPHRQGPDRLRRDRARASPSPARSRRWATRASTPPSWSSRATRRRRPDPRRRARQGLLPDDGRRRGRPRQRRRPGLRRGRCGPSSSASPTPSSARPSARRSPSTRASSSARRHGRPRSRPPPDDGQGGPLKDSGERNDLEAGMAKYLAAEYCADVVEQSFRIHGGYGYGYSKEYEIERLYREAPMLLIGEGTAEIQKMIIGRRLLEDYKLKG
jgi:hypothetical protein